MQPDKKVERKLNEEDEKKNVEKPMEKMMDEPTFLYESSEEIKVIKSFDELNLKPEILRGMYSYGFEKPSAVQQRAILPILEGRDIVIKSQSGTGKTCVFCVGALQCIDLALREPQILILSPTRELAEQNQKVMLALGDCLNVIVCNLM